MRWYIIVVIGFVVAVYTVFGGVVLSYLETNKELSIKSDILQTFASFRANHSCVSLSDVYNIQALLNAIKLGGVTVSKSGELQNITNWDIRTAMFVALQVLATVGFPTAAAKSVGGRAFTIVYAIFGIPLFLVTAIGMGMLLNHFAEKVRLQLSPVCCSYCTPHCGARVYRTIVIGIFGGFFFIVIPSIIFANIEPWTYADAFYFSFITLSTVGFGDLLPTYNDVPWMSENFRNWYRLAVAFWILLLCSWFAGVIVSIHTTITETEDKILHSDEISQPAVKANDTSAQAIQSHAGHYEDVDVGRKIVARNYQPVQQTNLPAPVHFNVPESDSGLVTRLNV